MRILALRELLGGGADPSVDARPRATAASGDGGREKQVVRVTSRVQEAGELIAGARPARLAGRK